MTTLVLGGARSGKSAFSENLVATSGLKPHYLATGRAWDGEMQDRIAEHRTRRGPQWTTHEEPLDLTGALSRLDGPDNIVLVDCLTLWVTNLMMEDRPMLAEFDRLVDAIRATSARLIFVSNEVGLGIVPDNAMARAFRDHAGTLHQRVAQVATQVYFIAAGLPLTLKG